MNNIFRVLFLILICPGFSQAQNGWQVIDLPSSVSKTCKITFPNSNTGYLLASGVFKTTDAGNTWIQKTIPFTSDAFYSLSFVNASTGFFCQSNNILYKTSNGGDNWTVINFQNSIYNMQFINSFTGWLLNTTTVQTTTDGGNTFTTYLISDTSLAFFSMDFINANSGWTAGIRSIFKTTNGGVNWQYLSRTTQQCYAVEFINELTGFIGGTSGLFSKTTDGGITWQTQNVGNAILRDINFINSQTGWVSGGGGSLFKTTNTGNNWVKYNIDTLLYLINIEFVNENTGWITTNKNKLLKTTNGGTVFVSQSSSAIPDNFELKQNYPNPFNPSTTINYNLRNSGHVELKVYDSKGNEIETPVNENQGAGSYSVYFDASKLPSGVYYYKLTSENFSETKKMILVK